MAQIKNNNTKKKFHKKKFNNGKAPKKKVKQHVLEDNEIKEIQESYEKIVNHQEIKTFDDIPLSKKTRKGLLQCKFKFPTDIQKQSLGPALKGKDILGASHTGSGKTLAFLIPILENLYLKKWSRIDGVGAIIISPTRELAYQTFETLKKVGSHHDFSSGLIIGGKNLKFERSRMDQINIIICTPGRLLQHFDENPLFNCTSLQILVLDEADRCLDLGFADTMNGIIENLPPERQTLLFSATQTNSVKDLARLSLKSPVNIAPHEKSTNTTPTSLQQNYVVINQEDKITMLWSFIKSHLKQKSIVFMSSCKQVKYTYEIFSKLRPGVSLLALYGTLHQDRRMAIYDEFCKRSKVVLFATDIASRGLDFPVVNWVIQLDCPENANCYIHRAGRTARHSAHGESLLVLTPGEQEPMLEELQANKIPINQISIDPKRLFSPRVKMEAFLAQSQELKETAQRSFIAYLKSVYLMKNKKVFNIETINIDEYAQSLGLVVTPRVRFLQRLKKRNDAKNKDNTKDASDDDDDAEERKPLSKPLDLNAMIGNDDSEDDDDAGIVQLKRRDHDIEENGDDDDDEVIEDLKQARKDKLITKAALAKKLIKKKIVPNKKIQFDEEGKAIVNTAKQLQSELAKEYEECEEGGINIEEAKKLLQEEDKFDRKRFKELIKLKHRESKKKLSKKKKVSDEDEEEEGDSADFDGSDDEPDVSWLPDYDKINKQANKNSDDDDDDSEAENDNSSGNESDENQIHKPPSKLYEMKRPYQQSSDDDEASDDESKSSDSDDDKHNKSPQKKKIRRNIAMKLNLNDTEAIAELLLSGRS